MSGQGDPPAAASTPAGAEPACGRSDSGMFAALSVRNFRRYVAGQSLSLIGTWVETVAQALLVLQLTHSSTILGLTTAARYAPILLLSPSAGLLVDRYHRGAAAGVPAVHDDLGAVPAELFGRCPADARGGPGNQGAEALEVPPAGHPWDVHLGIPSRSCLVAILRSKATVEYP
jgi:Transmembrane secretion effector